MIFVFSNLEKNDFKKLVKKGDIKLASEGIWFHNTPSMFSLIKPLVIELVNNKKFEKIMYESGKFLAEFYKDITLDEFFKRLAYQGFGTFEYELTDNKLMITGKSNFSRICFNNYKKKIKANVDALLIGLFEEVGKRLFKKCVVKELSCIRLGNENCCFKVGKS